MTTPSPSRSTTHLVHDTFSAVAEQYAVSTVHAQGEDLPEILRLAALTGTECVLDAGCGPGPVSLLLAPAAARVTAVDLSESMLDRGRRTAAERSLVNIAFHRGNLTDLPWPDGSFDLIVSRYAAHHWPDPQAVVTELARLLSPAGRLLLVDVMADPDPLLDTFLNALEILRDPSHVRDHSQVQWQAICQGAGLAAVPEFVWNLRLEFGPWVTRIQTPEARIAALQELLDGASAEVRQAFRIEDDHSFTVPGAILSARPVQPRRTVCPDKVPVREG